MGKKPKKVTSAKEKSTQQELSKMEVATQKDENKELVGSTKGDGGVSGFFRGVLDESAAGYLNQGLKSHPGTYNPEAKNTASMVIGSVMAIQPKGDIECMLVVQAVGVHNLSMEMMGRAACANRAAAVDLAVNQATKLSRTFVTLIEALNKHRGKGQQKMTVEHIHVNKGGQAIIGDVERGEGKNEK